MGTVALALVAALLWGASDFGAGLKSRSVSTLVVMVGMLGVGAVGGAVLLVVLGAPPLGREGLLAGLLAGVVTAIGLTALYRALAVGRMSIVAPISAGGVLVPVLVGIIGGERPSGVQFVGMGLAIAGMLVVVALASDDGIARSSSTTRQSVALAVLAAVGLGIYYVAAGAVEGDQIPWFVLLGQLSASLLLLVGILARGLPVPARGDALHIAGLGGLSFAAWAVSTWAIGGGDLSIAATITSLYPVVTVLLAVGLLRERVRRTQAAALLGTFAGVALVAGG